MDVSDLTVVGLESTSPSMLSYNLTVSGGIDSRNIVLLILIQNTTGVVYLNECSPLFADFCVASHFSF